MQKIKVITYATHDTPTLQALINSAQANGMDLIVLGIGDVWKGFGSKIIATYEYLKTLESYTHFIFVDGYDTLFVKPIIQLPDYLLFSTEKHKWPDPDANYPYEWSKDDPWPFLNSGVYGGPVDLFIDLISRYPPQHADDDQGYFTDLFLAGVNIKLDNECKYFQSYAFEEPGDFTVSGRFKNNVHNTYPAIIHFNGKTDGTRVYNMLKYPTLESVDWKDTPEQHKHLHETFIKKVNDVPELKEHRDFVEQHIFGFGERSFLWMWKLIVDKMPDDFTFMEIGVFKGQTLSLVKLLADMAGKQCKRIGVTPLSTEGGVWESNYLNDIAYIHDRFNLEKDYELIVGLSEDEEVIKTASQFELHILFIDGGHSEDHVINDLTHYAPLVKKNGYLVIDDCCNRFNMPWGYFQGIEAVSRVVDRMLPPFTPSDEWEFLFNVVHDRVYRRK